MSRPVLDGWLPVYAAGVEGDALAALGAVRLGVGKAAAAAALARELAARRPPGVLLFGVCGAFAVRHRPGTQLRVGDVVVVGGDRFGDEGVATEQGFVGIDDLGLGAVGPFAADRDATARVAAALGAPVVDGCTVSTCSGSEAAALAVHARTGAAVETMEGAAVALCCAAAGVPLVQLRAVANYTGDRARGAWDLPGAAAAVQAAVRDLLGGDARTTGR
ncbi:MAG: futalosine hydrolase [Planctomycetota bacterium]